MGKMKKKYTCGQATCYISRNRALRKLQLSLADFRRLCILKGVYPVEPKDRKKANKGVKSMKTFYYAKDIKLLSQEPVMQKFRALKIFARKLKHAKRRRDWLKAERVKHNIEPIKLDHIIIERYPQFTDAINDLDDCLCLVLLYATFPMDKYTSNDLISLCRQLYFEFLHYIMISRSLRKCFISIKGYYFQANLYGQNVTWIMPHQLCHQPSDSIDFKIMRTFLDFYVQMLGFVNFKLYADLNLIYPPKLNFTANEDTRNLASDIEFYDEMLSSLIINPNMQTNHSNDKLDPLTQELLEEEHVSDQIDRLHKLNHLFENCKFYISREVPRLIFAFVIRCFGGDVSWDQLLACGSTYPEDDESITHHIIDRPQIQNIYPNRIYVQPQWIFDCVNSAELLCHHSYLPGSKLPPHRSPFVSEQTIIDQKEEIEDDTKGDIRLMPSKLDAMTPEERKLREMMIPRKLKRIYKKAVYSRNQKRKQVMKRNDSTTVDNMQQTVN